MGKVLLIDVETAPNIAYVWGAWKQNVGVNQWVQNSHIMSFAAKWLDEDKIIYKENRKSDDSKIVKAIYDLLDDAEVVVAHNGDGFDLPTILGRGVVHNYAPPSPYYVVDTYRVSRRKFRFPQNSLAFIAKHLDLPRKGDHKKFPGFELWLGCLRNDDEAWDEMREYNIQDVHTLEALYKRILPYIHNHPNIAEAEEDTVLCPKCGSDHIHFRGTYKTRVGNPYARFQCQDCGGWGRMKNLDKDAPKNNGRNTV